MQQLFPDLNVHITHVAHYVAWSTIGDGSTAKLKVLLRCIKIWWNTWLETKLLHGGKKLQKSCLHYYRRGCFCIFLPLPFWVIPICPWNGLHLPQHVHTLSLVFLVFSHFVLFCFLFFALFGVDYCSLLQHFIHLISWLELQHRRFFFFPLCVLLPSLHRSCTLLCLPVPVVNTRLFDSCTIPTPNTDKHSHTSFRPHNLALVIVTAAVVIVVVLTIIFYLVYRVKTKEMVYVDYTSNIVSILQFNETVVNTLCDVKSSYEKVLCGFKRAALNAVFTPKNTLSLIDAPLFI